MSVEWGTKRLHRTVVVTVGSEGLDRREYHCPRTGRMENEGNDLALFQALEIMRFLVDLVGKPL